jgi:hypothetical protein
MGATRAVAPRLTDPRVETTRAGVGSEARLSRIGVGVERRHAACRTDQRAARNGTEPAVNDESPRHCLIRRFDLRASLHAPWCRACGAHQDVNPTIRKDDSDDDQGASHSARRARARRLASRGGCTRRLEPAESGSERLQERGHRLPQGAGMRGDARKEHCSCKRARRTKIVTACRRDNATCSASPSGGS